MEVGFIFYFFQNPRITHPSSSSSYLSSSSSFSCKPVPFPNTYPVQPATAAQKRDLTLLLSSKRKVCDFPKPLSPKDVSRGESSAGQSFSRKCALVGDWLVFN